MVLKPPFYAIGEIASQAGMRPSALRYYERVSLLPPPARFAGQRRYPVGVVDRLRLIGFAKQAGFRLAEIKTLLGVKRKGGRAAPVADGWRKIVPGKIVELEEQMAQLREARLRLQALLGCECRQPEQCGRRLQENLHKAMPAAASAR